MGARNATVKPKSKQRSRLMNGSAFVPSADGRTVWARIARDVADALVSHCGGQETLTETLRLQIRRIAVLEVELSFLEDKFANTRSDGKEPSAADLDLYGRLSNGQRRHLEVIGWQRIPKDISLTLANYINGGGTE